ncbi:hypothetical protein KAR91_72310 [Candidatus Pacearchaeota archaeon]|nr:hypothetical protein [Candidatus Pacearchaeota archaeon]
MKAKINPFRPNSLVNPGMFVGRVDELDRLEISLFQTLADQPESGKGSSLPLAFVDNFLTYGLRKTCVT